MNRFTTEEVTKLRSYVDTAATAMAKIFEIVNAAGERNGEEWEGVYSPVRDIVDDFVTKPVTAEEMLEQFENDENWRKVA